MPRSADVDRALDLPTGALTFFFSDVEGSTRLATSLGHGFASLLDTHRRVVRAAFEAHRGFEVSTGGDSFFAVFPVAADALAAAAAVQAGLEMAAAEGDAIRVRIGLHTGQAVRVGRDYVGLDVHVAARIGDAGHGGQVLVSETTRTALGATGLEGLALRDLGRHRLKDVGPQRLWQAVGRGLPAGPFPPLRTLEAHPSNLPAGLTAMVDRERERADLEALIVSSPITTVIGTGGIGKSRLAIEVARGLVERFPDGVFYLDVEASPDAEAVARALIELVGLRAAPDDPPRRVLAEGLRDRDLLIVLETADRVADLPALVASLTAICPHIRVLVTSRSPLHVTSERELPLAPLPPEPAAELFVARAHAVRPDFAPDAENRAAIDRLVERLDRIPLAIELAAARSKVFGPAALLDRLERQLPALGEGARDAPARQRTLRDTIAWSCDLLPADERDAFRQLAAFAGTFDLAAVEASVTVPGGADVLSLVERLVDRSLVIGEVGRPGEPRFRLMAPVREFALEALREAGLEDATRTSQLRHWIGFASGQSAILNTPSSHLAIQAVEADEPNIQAALGWALTSPQPLAGSGGERADRARLGLQLASAMGRYWSLRGRVHEGVGWLERALATADLAVSDPGEVDRDLAQAQFWAGVLLDDARRPEEAATRLEAALAAYRRLGDDVGIARTLNSLGVVARSVGKLDESERLLSESIERKRALGDQPGIAVSLSNLGILAGDRGLHVEAADYLRRALEIDETTGGATLIVAQVNLGVALIRAGDIHEGLRPFRACLPGLAELEDPELVADILVSLAEVSLRSGADGSAPRAARLLAASEALRERERQPLRTLDEREVDQLREELAGLVDPETMGAARSEARAIDVQAALALAREALS